MSDLSERIAKLSPEKRALLEMYLLKKNGVSKEHEIPKRANSESCQLSFAQQRLWFLDQLEPNSPLYNIPKAIKITGQLNLSALQKALNAIVERHESLRTVFKAIDGEPVQVVLKDFFVELPIINSEAEKAESLIIEEIRKPFDLTKDLMLRAKLIKLSENEHILTLVIHHIASDGWSSGIISRELAALYEAFINDKPSPLGELPIQYSDFAVWQRDWFQGETAKAQISYWKNKLTGAPPTIDIPTDKLRPPVQTYNGEKIIFNISKKLTDELISLSRKNNSTLFMILLAAFDVLLYRYTNQEDIVVGSAIANRNRIEIEELVGFFVNTLVMRSDLSGDPTFKELLGRVREVALEAYANQDMPFEKVVEELHIERDLSRSPVFQAMLVLQNTPKSKFELSGLTMDSIALDDKVSKFDMTLSITETEQGLKILWEYSTELFESDTIKRMFRHFENLLSAIMANPDQKISVLPLMDEAETHKLLVEWNDTIEEYSNLRVHKLFENQVEKMPNAVAVEFENERISYRELNAKANQLANYLKKLGVGPEIPVGLCLNRSIEMIVGILGILKAGGVYVPMNPNYPKERLMFMMEDTKALALLTYSESQLKAGFTICLDSDWEAISRESSENPDVNISPENLAYIIYTSGSTGKPKGVMIQHNSLVNFLEAANSIYQVSPNDRFLQFVSISFDVSIEEIFVTLLNGGTLVLRTDYMLDSIAGFLQKCRELNLTVLSLITPYWHELVATMELDSLTFPESLCLVVIGGEKALRDSFIKWKNLIGKNVRLINAYGPTETTIWTTVYELTEIENIAKEVPIGRPLNNIQLYVLDSNMRPVPIGVHGELYIGGVCLARGYLNQPELTAEKFIPNPFNGKNSRLYKTGDLVRYLPDGNIEFIGRIDTQVKIRGFRIELGEIEVALSQHPAIKNAVVIDREDIPGRRQLVAYIVPVNENLPEVSEIRTRLKEKLPDYMIPSAFVMMEALPLTPNNKIDRKALPAPDKSQLALSKSGDETVLPNTETEKILASIWSEVLNLEGIGIHDNFFELGGDSILSIKIVARANKAGLKITPRQMFQHQTIAELAAVAEKAVSIQQAESDISEIELSQENLDNILEQLE